MNRIGRKLYLEWGDQLHKYVVAIEKLPGASAEKMGLVSDNQFDSFEMKSLLVDIFEYLGEKIERPVNGTRFPLQQGMQFQDYFTDNSCWITKEEANASKKFYFQNDKKNVIKIGKFGENWTYYINPNNLYVDEINDWLKDHKKSDVISICNNILFISDKTLAIEFSMKFVD